MKDEPRNIGTQGRGDGGTEENWELRITNYELRPCSDDPAAQELKTVQLVPWGEVVGRHGTFYVDEESARLVEEDFIAQGNKLVIDYEHHSLGGKFSSPTGKAVAAGWIHKIWHKVGEGIFGAVEWIDDALELIRAKQYLYLSPVTVLRKSDRKLVGFHSVGLTNVPAIRHMELLAASQRFLQLENATMPNETTDTATADEAVSESEQLLIALGQLIQKFGLSVEASAGPLAVVKALLEKDNSSTSEGEGEGEGQSAASGAVLTALNLKEGASEEEVVVAVNTLAKGKEDSAALQTRVAKLETELAERKANDLLQPHIECGRINPHDKDDLEVCKALAMKDADAFRHHMAHRQPDPPAGETTAPSKPTKGSRQMVIANSAREYDAGGTKGRLTSKEAFVNDALRQAAMKALTDEECETLIG